VDFPFEENRDLFNDDGCSASQGCEMNGEINFTSLTGLWLGLCFAIGIAECKLGMAEAVFPNFSSSS
jgi:hypothetical protein